MGARKTTIKWEAQEYVTREKNKLWFVIMGVIVLCLLGLTIFLKDWTFALLVIVGAIALVLYVVRPPRTIKYSLDAKGLTEGDKFYKFEDFKSFGILADENNHYSIVLTPKKRFSPRNTVYFPETQGEEIVDGFGMHLPMEPVKLDLLDKVIRLLRI